ncbi:MAG: DUF6390 family protein [Candidatus Pacebacteria bacterium]|nr:DUF6390 family protein [Candidatus Paceibacterota bacterium]
MNGLQLFIKYALPPNVLGYCGPEGLSAQKNNAEELRNLLSRFEGAVPYLRLIALSNGIKDEFDERVVEAYWLGNDLLLNVLNKDLYDSIEERFEKKMKNKEWRWLVSQSIPQAKPHHVFHVFEIYRRAGLLRSGAKDKILETMDNCRIGWGTVKSINGGFALVAYSPLEFREKKLCFGKSTAKNFLLLDPSVKIGDEVSFHWNHVCDKITPDQKRNLAYWTDFHLKLVNKTI